jgi:hypothetical protein
MFQHMIGDFRETAGRALWTVILVAAAGFALLVAIFFLCAAAFIYLRGEYGVIEACLAGAGVFFIVAVLSAIAYKVRKNRARARAPERTKTALQKVLADPELITTGIQLVRAIGIKRLIPLVAVAGLAMGALANRHPEDKASQE